MSHLEVVALGVSTSASLHAPLETAVQARLGTSHQKLKQMSTDRRAARQAAKAGQKQLPAQLSGSQSHSGRTLLQRLQPRLLAHTPTLEVEEHILGTFVGRRDCLRSLGKRQLPMPQPLQIGL